MLLESMLLGIGVYLVYIRVNAWINDEELPTPSIIKLTNLEYEWSKVVPLVCIAFLLAVAIAAFASLVWPLALIALGVVGSAVYLRDKKRKEKHSEYP